MLPRDPMILLSYVNLKLRDFYPDLDSFCAGECVDKDYILDKLELRDRTQLAIYAIRHRLV